jgi:2,4-dienoyl-CoA reductase-like NADH-dependent reductase (Old Yellow Enzyme family)
MSDLFDQTTINGMTLQNRLVRSATWEGMCDADGRPTDKLASCYRDLAAGGTGLIISGYTFIRREGKQMPGKMGIHSDSFAPDMESLTKTVHDAGGKICIQLVHCGGQTNSGTAGRQPLAPSAIQVDQFPEMPAELTADEISNIVTAFGEGARRAKVWGFDAVQLHGAHGYLINQFLSPLTNRRTDEYGGSIENRCRFLLEVYSRVREAVGTYYPVLIKLTAADNLEGGLDTDDAVYAAKKLSEQGIDAIEVSAGTPASGDQSPARVKIDTPAKEAYNLEQARRIKETVTCPVMVVGGFRTYEVARKAVGYNGMANLALRWKQGDTSPAKCISCNGCFKPGLKEGGIYCVVEAKERLKGKNND